MEELTVGTRVDHPRYGEGIISKNNLTAYEIFFERGGKNGNHKKKYRFNGFGT